MAKFINPTKVITGVKTRWSYVNAWEPKSINGGVPKYSVSLIIPKSDTKTIEKIQAAIQAADKVFSPFRSSCPMGSLLLSVGTRTLFGVLISCLFWLVRKRKGRKDS